jgi:hypothetical protein
VVNRVNRLSILLIVCIYVLFETLNGMIHGESIVTNASVL